MSGAGENEGGLSFTYFRDGIITSFVRDKYHSITSLHTRHFYRLSIDSGYATKSTSAHKIFKEINNSIRNAMNHIGYASVAEFPAQVENQVHLADWHLSIANARALIPSVQFIRAAVRDTNRYGRLLRKLPFVASAFGAPGEVDRQTLDYLNHLSDNFVKIRDKLLPELIRRVPPLPTPPERDKFSADVDELAAILTVYTQIHVGIWEGFSPIDIKLIRFRIWIFGVAALLSALAIGVGGNFLYDVIKSVAK